MTRGLEPPGAFSFGEKEVLARVNFIFSSDNRCI